VAFKWTLRKAKRLPVVNSYNYENGQIGVWHSSGKQSYKIVYKNSEAISVQDLKDGELYLKPTASARRKVKVSIDNNMACGSGFDGIYQLNSSLYIKNNLILLQDLIYLTGKEMQDSFTMEEILILIIKFNYPLLTGPYADAILKAKQALIRGLNEMPSQPNADIKALEKKVETLGAFQIVWLCRQLQRFWHQQRGKHPQIVQKSLSTKKMINTIKSDFHIS